MTTIDDIVVEVTIVKNRDGRDPIVYKESRKMHPDSIAWLANRKEGEGNQLMADKVLARTMLEFIDRGEALIEAGKSQADLVEEFGDLSNCYLIDGKWQKKDNTIASDKAESSE